MLPAQRKKVDMSTLTEEEKKLFRLYGKLPTHKNVLTKMQKDRKFFDSGDYALSKAGVTPQNAVGTAIPSPENIPHPSSPPVPHNASGSSPPSSSAIPFSSPTDAHAATTESHMKESTIFPAADADGADATAAPTDSEEKMVTSRE